MKKSHLLVILSLAVLAAVVYLSLRPRRHREQDILAVVGDEWITAEQLRRVWQALSETEPVSPELVLQGIIEEKKLVGLARAAGIEETDRFRRALAEVRESLLVELFLEEEFSALPSPGEREIEEFWRENAADFAVPELVRVSHILLRDSPDKEGEAAEFARSLLRRAGEGEDFAELARRYSQADSAPRGGDLGFFRPGQLLPELEGVARGLETGGIAGPVRTDYGYHLVKVTDRRPPRLRELDEARDEVVSALLFRRRQERMAELREKAVRKTPVWVDEVRLERMKAEMERGN